MADKIPITSAYLRSILNYDSETGIWTWKWRDDVRREDNKRLAGKEAGKSSKGSRGYKQICINRHPYYSHYLAFIFMLGAVPVFDIDHEDANRANCAFNNLRPATRSQNNANRSVQAENKSGFKWVSYDAARKTWRGTITFQDKKYMTKRCKTPKEAHELAIIIANKLYPDFYRAA